MSILETFYIVFKGDTTDAKKSFSDLTKSIVTFAASASAGYLVLNNFMSATNQLVSLGNVSRQLGVDASALDAWGNAAKRFGGTAESFQQSLKGLSQHLGTSPALALKVLPQLADVFQRIGRVRAQSYGQSLGLDQPTIYMLQQGRRELEGVLVKQKELGLITQQSTETAAKYNAALLNTEQAFRGISLELAVSALPFLTKFLDVVTPAIEYLREHIDLVKGAMLAIVGVGAVLAAPFIITNAAIIATITGVSALIALFAVAYEDIKAFANGQSSLIGDILQKWPKVGSVMKATFEGLESVLWAILEPFKLIGQLIDKGQRLIGQAASSPLNSATSSSISNSRSLSSSRSVSTGPITINTQATDGYGVANALQKHLDDHFWHSNSNFDDGQLA